MLKQEQRECFARDGYLIVPGVLSDEQVSWLRSFFRPKFELSPQERFAGDTDHVLFDVFARYSEVRWLLFHRPALEVLRSLLGEDFVVLRETAAHLNHFAPWHKDTSSQEAAGHRFHWEDDYLMVEAGYYLQPNSEDWGGGLDVEPGTHREPELRLKPSLVDRALARLGLARGPLRRPRSFVSVPTRSGDLLVFDFRLNHRGTVPARPAHPEHDKMAVFIACSRNSRHVRAYQDHIGSRPEYAYLKAHSYPDDLVREARLAGLTLA